MEIQTMRKAKLFGFVLVAIVLLAVVPSYGQGPSTACVTGTLESYIELGATGCTFDGAVYANFTYQAGNSGITANEITVTPLGTGPVATGYYPGLNFAAPWKASAGVSQQSVIGYTVAPFTTVSSAATGLISLVLGNSTVSGIFGSVAITEATNVGTLSVFEKCADACTLKRMDQLNFTPIQELRVTDTVSLSGGNEGASLSNFAANYNFCAACVEP